MSLVRISSDGMPADQRTSQYSDVLNSVLGLELLNLGDGPMHVAAQLRRLPGGVVVAASTFSPISMVRAAVHVADGNDDLVLSIPLEGGALYRQRGRPDIEGRPGGAYVLFNEKPSEIRNGNMRRLSLAIPRSALSPGLANLDVALGGVVAATPTLALLTDYVQSLVRGPEQLEPELERLAATHVCDLVSLLLGAAGDAAGLAHHRGVRQARLQALKADIAAGLRDAGLSIDRLARRHAISPRYVQALLKSDGTTFRDLLLAERLANARRLLLDPSCNGMSVSRIAYASGFGDLSHFNQTFRRRFGITPTDMRRSGAR
ncbi:MAG: AraC family transcriptional regulator [Rhizobiaceae bacterium]